ncbi:hypothetical protein CSUB01_12524 [Colletotrichum sublineola]|uniref:Uncharacterized protein n=1 Tax=Colletotrichum sublineola TaxID=1173701 RepID=A0A066XR57_COLSU|nr:hypothetical protein CSUB01_12524 [Colletotrichum sublineola]
MTIIIFDAIVAALLFAPFMYGAVQAGQNKGACLGPSKMGMWNNTRGFTHSKWYRLAAYMNEPYPPRRLKVALPQPRHPAIPSDAALSAYVKPKRHVYTACLEDSQHGDDTIYRRLAQHGNMACVNTGFFHRPHPGPDINTLKAGLGAPASFDGAKYSRICLIKQRQTVHWHRRVPSNDLLQPHIHIQKRAARIGAVQDSQAPYLSETARRCLEETRTDIIRVLGLLYTAPGQMHAGIVAEGEVPDVNAAGAGDAVVDCGLESGCDSAARGAAATSRMRSKGTVPCTKTAIALRKAARAIDAKSGPRGSAAGVLEPDERVDEGLVAAVRVYHADSDVHDAGETSQKHLQEGKMDVERTDAQPLAQRLDRIEPPRNPIIANRKY